MSNLDDVSNRLGHVESSVEHIDKRLDKIDTKLDKFTEMSGMMEHIKNNVSMMKQPVEDYKSMKERGTGMWMLITFVLGGATVLFNIISYVVRVWVLKIGG